VLSLLGLGRLILALATTDAGPHAYHHVFPWLGIVLTLTTIIDQPATPTRRALEKVLVVDRRRRGEKIAPATGDARWLRYVAARLSTLRI